MSGISRPSGIRSPRRPQTPAHNAGTDVSHSRRLVKVNFTTTVFKRPVGLLPLILLLCIAPTADPAPPWNVGYRTIAVQDALTGESFPVVLWYPTAAAPAPLFVTGALALCRFPAILCRRIAYEM